MAAYAEGLAVLRSANVGNRNKELTPRPRHYAIRNIINLTLLCLTSPRYGDAVA
jgi:hypothetical protein